MDGLKSFHPVIDYSLFTIDHKCSERASDCDATGDAMNTTVGIKIKMSREFKEVK